MASNNTAMYKIGYYVGQAFKLNLGKKKPITVYIDLDNGSDSADGISSPTSNAYQAFRTSEQYYMPSIEFTSQNTTTVASSSKIFLSDMIHMEINSSIAITWQIQKQDDNLLAGGFIIQNSYVVFNNQVFNIEQVNQQAGVDFCYPFVIRYSTVIFNNCRFSADSMVMMLLSGSTVVLNSCSIDGNGNVIAQCFEVPSLVSSLNCDLGDNKLKDETSLWIQTT